LEALALLGILFVRGVLFNLSSKAGINMNLFSLIITLAVSLTNIFIGWLSIKSVDLLTSIDPSKYCDKTSYYNEEAAKRELLKSSNALNLQKNANICLIGLNILIALLMVYFLLAHLR